MATRWKLPEDLSASEKRKLRKELRAKMAAEGPESVREYLADPDEPAPAKKTRKSNNKQEEDEGAEDDGEEAESSSKQRRRRKAKLSGNLSSEPLDLEKLTAAIVEAGVPASDELEFGYGFSPDGSTTADQLLTRFEEKHGYPPEMFRVMAGNLIVFGPIPETTAPW